MLINSTLHGACLAPFYDASLFPLEGGCVFDTGLTLFQKADARQILLDVSVQSKTSLPIQRYVASLARPPTGPTQIVSSTKDGSMICVADRSCDRF